MSIHLCTLYTHRLNLTEPGGSANHNPSGVALAVGHFKSFHVISSIHNLTRSWFSVHPVLQSQRTLDCHGFLMFFSATGQSVRLFLGDSGAAVTGSKRSMKDNKSKGPLPWFDWHWLAGAKCKWFCLRYMLQMLLSVCHVAGWGIHVKASTRDNIGSGQVGSILKHLATLPVIY